MKTLRYILITLGTLAINQALMFAQAPQKVSYQAVARNASGNPIPNQAVTLRLSIHDSNVSGPIVFQETQNAMTNQFGLFNIQLGQGTPNIGIFPGIDWATNSKYLQVEIDPAGGSTFQNAGTNELISVPYALHANSSGDSHWDDSGSHIVNNNTGNVGIGTATPLAKLQIVDSTNTALYVKTGGNSPQIAAEQMDANNPSSLSFHNVGSPNTWNLRSINSTGNGILDTFRIHNTIGGNVVELTGDGRASFGYDMGIADTAFRMYVSAADSGSGIWAVSETGSIAIAAITESNISPSTAIFAKSNTVNGYAVYATNEEDGGTSIITSASGADGVAIEMDGKLKVSGTNKTAFQLYITFPVVMASLSSLYTNQSSTDMLFITPNVSGTANSIPPCKVYWDGTNWNVMSSDNISNIPTGTIFNVLLIKQ